MTLINMLIMILEDHKQRTKLTCTQSSKEETVYGNLLHNNRKLMQLKGQAKVI